MEHFGIFYDRLEYFIVICYILWHLGIHSVWSFAIFFPFWYVWTRKIWQPWYVYVGMYV
jgi:hypothetical protein